MSQDQRDVGGDEGVSGDEGENEGMRVRMRR